MEASFSVYCEKYAGIGTSRACELEMSDRLLNYGMLCGRPRPGEVKRLVNSTHRVTNRHLKGSG